MRGNVSEVSENQCCGCGACHNICPVNAITMLENNEGFLYPYIDSDKCVHCGLCLKNCTAYIPKKTQLDADIECYAARGDDEIRLKSSSGGIFSLLANYILDQGGSICGAAFDDNWNVHHIIIDSKSDLDKLRGSKYVQSDMENCYSEIKTLLKNDRYVLFSGTPCQVAALYSFLGKDFEKLYTVDILCHGTPSRGVWEKYLSENFTKAQIANVNFRDKKEIGWSCSSCTITLKDNSKIISDEYTALFHRSLILRKSCAYCNYSKFPRPANITLGDWWGISRYDKTLNDGKGLNFVLLNNDKGKHLYSKINCESTRIHLSKDYNNGNIRYGVDLHPCRDKFFGNLDKYNLKQLKGAYLDNRFDVCLLTTFYADNYGAILDAYAANTIITELGYSVLMLQKPSGLWTDDLYGDTVSQKFATKHYNVSRVYNTKAEMRELNAICERFVVGSDQIFNPGLGMDFALLGFANASKNKISFATSFGHDLYRCGSEETKRRQYLFDRFNAISLRETSPKLCKEIFHLDAKEVIDPTLMLPQETYNQLCDSVLLSTPRFYILAYFLDINQKKEKALKYLSQKLGMELIYVANLRTVHRGDSTIKPEKDYTPEEFLYLYKNAAFVCTDSFHGTCFAVKYHKPFISFTNKARGGLRYKMFDKLGVSSRVVPHIDDIYIEEKFNELTASIDYTPVQNRIDQESEQAIKWLRDKLANPAPLEYSSEKITETIDYVDHEIAGLTQKINDLNQEVSILRENKFLLNKSRIRRRYYRFKLLSHFHPSRKKRSYYREKKRVLHQQVRKIRFLEKEE